MAKPSPSFGEFPLDIDENEHALMLLRKFNRMRIERRECDLIIKVEGNEIHAHRSVMMAGSDYFDAMFTHDMEEKRSGVVEMKDISFSIMGKLVEFIYTGKLFLREDECEELLFASSMLQLTSICAKITPFLARHLNPSSFFSTKMIANKFDLADVKKACDDFALENLDEIVKEHEFVSLDKEYICFLVTTKKSALPQNEESKVAMVLRWIKADVENRNQYLIDISSLFDFGKISPGYGKYLAKNEPICFNSPQFMTKLFLASISDHEVVEKRAKISFKSPNKNSLVIFDQSAKVMKAFNPLADKWTEMQALHQNMHFGVYTAVVMENFIYVLLGNKKAYKLDAIVGISWENVPDMLKEHHAPRATFCAGNMYVTGSNSMEVYNPIKSKWIVVNCSGISNCNQCALAVHDNAVYVLGGYNGSEFADVCRYSPLTSSWSSLASMPSQRQNAAATVLGGKIYVAGGYHLGYCLDDFMSYDPKLDVWSCLRQMSLTRSYFSLCTIADHLYAVGNNSACKIEEYSFEEEQWKLVSDYLSKTNTKIAAAATVVIERPET